MCEQVRSTLIPVVLCYGGTLYNYSFMMCTEYFVYAEFIRNKSALSMVYFGVLLLVACFVPELCSFPWLLADDVARWCTCRLKLRALQKPTGQRLSLPNRDGHAPTAAP